jgi:hypothetical protein
MRWLSAILLIASAGLFMVAGNENPAIVPAVLLGIAGLWAWDRGGRQQPELPKPAPQPTAEDRIRPLEQRLISLQEELAVTQRHLLQLGEERDFLRRLYPTGQPDRLPSSESMRR